ncbi:expressed unknown protein [Seminavis robusta]|uniref:Hint domain-containing protein n=1 Tax=Seminavis robusta TaxID=568900 RepID=A0A9N8EIS6_9STRA|nr:expressed unknown protein [Seminavis robusta]|eukprot:Sro1267_g257661.1  (318) ;mRNA; r:17329-18373
MKICYLLASAMPLLASAATPEPRGLKGVARHGNEEERQLQDAEPRQDIDLGEIFGFGCFSQVSTVQVENKGPVAMKDLQVGDKILTASNEYQPVYSFGHWDPTTEARFLQFHTKEGTVLEMTPEHLVFEADNNDPVRADSLQVGDVLRGNNPQSSHTIAKIDSIQREGLYAPFTEEGTLVVDGIVASSYISLQHGHNDVKLQNGASLGISQHDYVHMGIAPLRLLCLGVSGRYCSTDYYTSEGMPFYAAFSVWVNLWVNEQSSMVQMMAFGVISLLTGACLAAETMFGASRAPLALCAMATAMLHVLVHRRRSQKNA